MRVWSLDQHMARGFDVADNCRELESNNYKNRYYNMKPYYDNHIVACLEQGWGHRRIQRYLEFDIMPRNGRVKLSKSFVYWIIQDLLYEFGEEMNIIIKRGRPQRNEHDELIRKLHLQGYGSQRIHNVLKSKGIAMARSTVDVRIKVIDAEVAAEDDGLDDDLILDEEAILIEEDEQELIEIDLMGCYQN